MKKEACNAAELMGTGINDSKWKSENVQLEAETTRKASSKDSLPKTGGIDELCFIVTGKKMN